MKSLAVAYAMKRKAKKMSQGGEAAGETLGTAIGYPGSPKPRPKAYSDGDVVSRVMARMSEGGRIANGSMTEGLADELPNEFDDLVLRDDLESTSDGANNGDEIGNAQEDEDRDLVSRAMARRAKR